MLISSALGLALDQFFSLEIELLDTFGCSDVEHPHCPNNPQFIDRRKIPWAEHASRVYWADAEGDDVECNERKTYQIIRKKDYVVIFTQGDYCESAAYVFLALNEDKNFEPFFK